MASPVFSCPKCSYSLVLLEHRSKYKCSKCGRLFPQRGIDNDEFRKYNERQRELDKEALKQKIGKLKLSEEERGQRRIESQQKYKNKNIEKVRAYDRKRWHEGTRKEYSKQLYQRNLARSRIQKRILYYRIRQKELAIQKLEIIRETIPVSP